MKNHLLGKGRGRRRAAQLAGALSALAGAGMVGGCLQRPLEPIEPRTTTTIVERLTQSSVDKIDLVLAIDNSRSMADKQQILAQAVPDLGRGLVNPRCLNPDGTPAATQPTGPLEACETGTKREFEPVVNIHIGIISSSLGGHGADACPTTETNTCNGSPNPSNNDAGHLLARVDACSGQAVPTYQNKSFLAWDPAQKLTPPGEKDIGEINPDLSTKTPGIVPTLKDMVIGAGQVGCGYEAQLESWYRFLIDPEPYQSITVQAGKAVPQGIDDALLKQRADFLRPSSLLAIIMLTDENDCSIKEFGQFYFAAQTRNPNNTTQTFYLPRARAICATDPNSECCRSCGQSVDASCGEDMGCKTNPTLSPAEDDINMRCFDQKRRFGIDFLYPIDRYTTALTSVTVPNRAGELVPNPIFSDLNPDDQDTNIRDRGLVFLAGITGVPWQDIARDPKDLKQGFKSFDELNAKTMSGDSTWDIILGDLANYVPPKDPHMIESQQPRSGTNPITGDQIAPPTAPNGTNPINGHEWTTGTGELQYACIFPLPQARDCVANAAGGCDCTGAMDNPLCEPNPADNNNPTLQVRAKAYPGTRELAVLKSVQGQGIVASVCPAQLTDATQQDYGYRPAIGSIIDRLKVALGGQCLPRTLTPDAAGQVSCLILEARNSGGQCACDEKEARIPVSEEHQAAQKAAEQDEFAATAKWDCFCEIKQLDNGDEKATNDDELKACQDDASNPPTYNGQNLNGWCYIDDAAGIGNPEIVKNCPATERRLVRFVGAGNPKPGATLFITCSGE